MLLPLGQRRRLSSFMSVLNDNNVAEFSVGGPRTIKAIKKLCFLSLTSFYNAVYYYFSKVRHFYSKLQQQRRFSFPRSRRPPPFFLARFLNSDTLEDKSKCTTYRSSGPFFLKVTMKSDHVPRRPCCFFAHTFFSESKAAF